MYLLEPLPCQLQEWSWSFPPLLTNTDLPYHSSMFIHPTKALTAVARSKPSPIRRFSKFDLYGSAPIPDNRSRLIPKSGSYPLGFSIGSVKAGIKYESSPQPDLALVASDRPLNGAVVFTKNEFPAASITVSREVVQRTRGHRIQTIIANSGCSSLLRKCLVRSRELVHHQCLI